MSDNNAKSEQFTLLAKSARGLALVDLIAKATAEPGLFSFGELLSLPSVQEVSSTGGLAGAEGWEGRLLGWACSSPPPARTHRTAPRKFLCPQLRGGQHASAYALLELFAYGTWADYNGETWDTQGRLFTLPTARAGLAARTAKACG